MSPATSTFLVLLALLGLNRWVVAQTRSRRYALGRRGHQAVHWLVQALNLGSIAALLTGRLPGFDRDLGILAWVVGALLLVHVVENETSRLDARRKEAIRRDLEEERAHTAALRQEMDETTTPPGASPPSEPPLS